MTESEIEVVSQNSDTKVYGFNIFALLGQLAIVAFIGLLVFVAIDFFEDEQSAYHPLFMLLLLTIFYGIYIEANDIYEIISTKVVLFADHFIFKSGKKNIQMKYVEIESIRMSRGSPKVKDIYGNRISLSRSLISNVWELTDTLMAKAVNASLPEDIIGLRSVEEGTVVLYCKNCQKEFYVKELTVHCPNCGKRQAFRFDIKLDFQIVKNKKLNDILMYVIWTTVGVCLLALYIVIRLKLV